MQNYWKADFVTELTDEAIAAHVEHGKRTPNVHSSMHLHPSTARLRVGADETAFGHRDKSFAPVIVGIWPDPGRQRGQHQVGEGLLRSHSSHSVAMAATSTSCPATTNTERLQTMAQLRAARSSEGDL